MDAQEAVSAVIFTVVAEELFFNWNISTTAVFLPMREEPTYLKLFSL